MVTGTVANISRQNVVDESENLVEKIEGKKKRKEKGKKERESVVRFYIELELMSKQKLGHASSDRITES